MNGQAPKSERSLCTPLSRLHTTCEPVPSTPRSEAPLRSPSLRSNTHVQSDAHTPEPELVFHVTTPIRRRPALAASIMSKPHTRTVTAPMVQNTSMTPTVEEYEHTEGTSTFLEGKHAQPTEFFPILGNKPLRSSRTSTPARSRCNCLLAVVRIAQLNLG
ncbi:hypothetical protein PM082_014563 [Marasmius tenuissimus]|nr:hypothetical protein PM082_014563 [Marasmius tenuissimus]